MKRSIEDMIDQFQRSARLMDIGDVTSEPRTERVALSKDEVIDLMVDAYHLGYKDARTDPEKN